MAEDRRRVLVVDDDASIRILVERVLRRENYEVDSAGDGFEAIEKLAANDYDAILLDLMMPRIDGFGVLQYLDSNRPELRRSVIVMTANLQGAVEAALSGKISRVLPKPFELSVLLAEVRA